MLKKGFGISNNRTESGMAGGVECSDVQIAATRIEPVLFSVKTAARV
jgi:hypothetical protein